MFCLPSGDQKIPSKFSAALLGLFCSSTSKIVFSGWKYFNLDGSFTGMSIVQGRIALRTKTISF